MSAQDQLTGFLFIAAGCIAFFYYTTWAIVLPYLEQEHSLRAYFPSEELVIKLPLYLLFVGVGAIAAFILRVTLNKGKKKSN